MINEVALAFHTTPSLSRLSNETERIKASDWLQKFSSTWLDWSLVKSKSQRQQSMTGKESGAAVTLVMLDTKEHHIGSLRATLLSHPPEDV